MNRLIYSDGFLEDMLSVESERIETAIFDAIALLPYIPVLGSKGLPSSIERDFGIDSRKISVSPFDIIYKIVEDDDFLILGLVHERSAY